MGERESFGGREYRSGGERSNARIHSGEEEVSLGSEIAWYQQMRFEGGGERARVWK